jgi:hypothetical protein
MTVKQLIAMLSQLPPHDRVVVPGQAWGEADVGDVASRRYAFWHGTDPAMGNWIRWRRGLCQERCVVIEARRSAPRRRQAAT